MNRSRKDCWIVGVVYDDDIAEWEPEAFALTAMQRVSRGRRGRSMASEKRYTVEDEIFIVDPDGNDVCEVSLIDSEDCCAELNRLLDRVAALEAERDDAQADCKAMAAALAALPRATVVASDGTVNLCYGVVVGPDAQEAVRRWRP